MRFRHELSLIYIKRRNRSWWWWYVVCCLHGLLHSTCSKLNRRTRPGVIVVSIPLFSPVGRRLRSVKGQFTKTIFSICRGANSLAGAAKARWEFVVVLTIVTIITTLRIKKLLTLSSTLIQLSKADFVYLVTTNTINMKVIARYNGTMPPNFLYTFTPRLSV